MMTSISLRKKVKLASVFPSDAHGTDYCTEREGIFDQFSNEANKELYFYTVYSSSDSEGNITSVDVKRERFNGDVNQGDGQPDDEELKVDEQKPPSLHKKRYGFRTRRSRKHKDDDEFETSLGDSSSQSGDEHFKSPVSSDDETYDIVADNWAFVRGAKKKDTSKKKTESPKKSPEKSLKKSPPLKIRLKSTFVKKKRGSKLQKLAESFRKAKLASKSGKATLTVSHKAVKVSAKREKQDSVKSGNPSPKKVESPKISHSEVSQPVQRMSKRNASQIRCGYNSTAPKLQEIRHIRRRQLRQTPSRISQSNVSIYEEASSSSADEDYGGESQKTHGVRTRKISRIENESNFKEKPDKPVTMTSDASSVTQKSRDGKKPVLSSHDGETAPTSGSIVSISTTTDEQNGAEAPSSKRISPRRIAKTQHLKETKTAALPSPATSSAVTPRTPSSDIATTTTSTLDKNGLKLVIRRQSIDPPSHEVRSDHVPDPNLEKKLKEYSPGFLDARKKQILQTIGLKTLKATACGMAGKEDTENAETLTKPDVKQFECTTDRKSPDNCEENRGLHKEAEDKSKASSENAAGTDASPQSGSKDSPSSKTNKASLEDEAGKKKKVKKRRKKDRGRSGSSAGNEDAFDAQHTAMRLAMELPRHNWLVNSLIKDNKLKAEDDKPLNNLPDGEEGNAQTQGNNTGAKELQKTITSQEVPAGRAEAQNAPEDATQTQGEDIQRTEGRKHPNAVKGSFMVGIVKPFQHLKMSPSAMEAGETSPPMLRIADEEEDIQSPEKENGHKPKVQNGDISIKIPATEARDLKESVGKDAASEIFSTAPCTENKVVTSAEDIVVATKQLTPVSIFSSVTVNTAEISQCAVEEDFSKFEPKANLKPSPVSEKNKTDSVDQSSEVNNNCHQKPDANEPKNGQSTSGEAEAEIKISNCFSLALDLTKKGVNLPVTKSPDSDQPLDLTTGPKSGQTSPKILDLSVKKPPSVHMPEREGVTQPKPVTVSQEKPFVPQSLTEVTRTPRQSPQPFPVVQKEPAFVRHKEPEVLKSDRNVIVIDDDTAGDKPSPSHNTSSAQRLSPAMAVLKMPPASKSSSVLGKETSNLKRAASYDSTPPRSASGVSPTKRSRLSLDEMKSTARVQENQIQPAQTAWNHSQPMSSAGGTTLNPPKQMFAYAPALKPLAPKGGNKRLSDLLMIGRSTASVTRAGTLPIPTPMNVVQSSYPSLPIQNPQPSSPVLPRSVITSTYTPTPRMPLRMDNNIVIGGGVMNNVPPTGFGDLKAAAATRSSQPRHLNPSHKTAQLVAKSYTTSAKHLEPYIKEEQRKVDQKIQELEAIKRQLAKASASAKAKTPPPPYPRAPPAGPERYLPPRILASSIPHQKISPPSQYQALSMQRPANIRPSLAVHRSPMGNVVNSMSMPLRQGQIAQSQYAVPTTGRVCPPSTISRPAIPQPRIQAPQSWRVLPPHVGQGTELSNRPYQRNLSSGVQVPPNAAKIPGNQAGLFSRPPTTPSQLLTNQIPAPASWQSPQQSVLPRPQISVPRMLPMTVAPVYRNGGLTIKDTFKTRLNEPIIIEDDIIRSSGATQDSRIRPVQTRFIPEALKVRRLHSYHPPLSKNRVEQGQMPQTVESSQWAGRPTTTATYKGSDAPPNSDGPSEYCVKCRRKAYFLCSGCRKIWYCSKDCQVKDWSLHSAKCKG